MDAAVVVKLYGAVKKPSLAETGGLCRYLEQAAQSFVLSACGQFC